MADEEAEDLLGVLAGILVALAVKAAERIVGPRAVVGIRRRAVEVSTDTFTPRYQAYFKRMAGGGSKASAFEIERAYIAKVGSPEAKAGLKRILDDQYATMTEVVWRDVVGAQVGTALSFDLNARGVERVMDRTATKVTQITDASKQMIRDRVEAEITEGPTPTCWRSASRISCTVLGRGWGPHPESARSRPPAGRLARKQSEGYGGPGAGRRQVQVCDRPELAARTRP